jgi:DNA repair protein RecN (Recombination protein N)
MLSSIRIKNISIIDNIEIDFDKGLNIITGETGAGKSVFLNSILLLLGKKLSPNEIIRTGADFAEVEALIWSNEEDIVIRREIIKEGRGKVYINGRFASINELKELAKNFIEFSGQNQNQILFNKSEQLKFIDIFGNLEMYLSNYREVLKNYRNINKKLKNFIKKEEEINSKKQDIIEDLKILEKASLNDIDEEELLKRNIELAENYEKIKYILNRSYYEVIDNDNSIIKKIAEIKRDFLNISELKPGFKEVSKLLSEIEINLGEVEKLILSEMGECSENEVSLDALYERQNLINRLKKRFNKSCISELIKLRDDLKVEVANFGNIYFDIEKLQKEQVKIFEKLKNKAEILSEKRKEASVKLEREVKEHLEDLKMTKVEFKILFNKLENFSENGIDEIEYLITTNVGEPLKPLNKIVSGGELSRIMLALKTVLSDYLQIPVLIFDEVDSGTGGEVAFAIGKKLKEVSKNHQVFAITHLPQVAAFSDSHYKIEKNIENNKAVSKIKKLETDEKILEIARMISGDNITNKSMENAKELIEAGRGYELKTG